MKTITRYRIYWAFQHEEEEAWLNRMSARGYHLTAEPGIFVYNFEYDPSVRYTYRLDFANREMDNEDFDAFYEEMEWETVGKMLNGWYYFRKPFSADKEEVLYTDPGSKARLYRRVRRMLGGVLGLEAAFLVIYSPMHGEMGILGWLWLPFLLLVGWLGYNVWKLSLKIRDLEREDVC